MVAPLLFSLCSKVGRPLDLILHRSLSKRKIRTYTSKFSNSTTVRKIVLANKLCRQTLSKSATIA